MLNSWSAHPVGISVCIQQGARCAATVGPTPEWESPNWDLEHSEKKDAQGLERYVNVAKSIKHFGGML